MTLKRHLDDELIKLREKLYRMGLLVEKAVEDSMEALVRRDDTLAQAVIKGDQDINLYEMEIDQLGHELIALYAPAAMDLRQITMSLKMTNDLERMGDQAVNIAQSAVIINKEQPIKPFEHLPEMRNRVRAMVRDALNAFMERNADKARAVLESDDGVDNIHHQIYRDVEAALESAPGKIRTGISLIMISHNLERIADLATNIAEDVIYMKKGIDIRHHIRERRPEEA